MPVRAALPDGYVSVVDLSAPEAGLRQLAGFPVTGENTAELLRQAMIATRRIPGVSGAALMLVDTDQTLRHAVASDEPGMALQLRQEEIEHGPCVDAFRFGRVVATADLRSDRRWPALAAAMAGTPVRAVLAVPTVVGDGPMGTLNVYADRPHDWDDGETAALSAFGRVLDRLLAAAVAQDRSDQLAQQLQFALDYRVVIERAIGYLMHREGVDGAAAFARLRSAARSNRRKVIDVARDVLEGRSTASRPTRSRQS